MYPRASSFSHPGYQYQQANYSQHQPKTYSQPTGQYEQYGSQGSQQSPITPDNPYGSQDWATSYDMSAASMDFSTYQMSLQANGMDLDLASQPNPAEVESVDVDAFTTSAHQEWRPPGFPGSELQLPNYQAQSQTRHYGAMSDPTPHLPHIIEVSSDEASNDDSAYMTAPHANTATAMSIDGLNFPEQLVDANASVDGVSTQSRSPYGRPRAAKFASDSQLLQAGVRKGRRKMTELSKCSCGYVPKNQSDSKKHTNRHIKPYKCNFPECLAKGIGFATDNDLDRHRKSGKHKLPPMKGSGKGYICCACPVGSDGTPKWWDRLDNFRSHVTRKHKDQEMQTVVRASERNARPDNAITEFGENSTYFSGSVADHDHIYQQQDMSSQAVGGSQHLSNQGEIPLWSEREMTLPPINELSGVGRAQHLADTGISRPFPGLGGRADECRDDEHDGSAGLDGSGHLTESRVSCLEPPSLNPGEDLRRSPSEHAIDENGSGNPVQCQECGKTKKRPCDLRKHMKRHTRPYGCTMPGCYVRHGSRSDWKRHEMKAHAIHESWKCTLARLNGNLCHANFSSEDKLRAHLDKHDLMSVGRSVVELAEEMHLGREGHGRFWCGFCNAIVAVDHSSGGKHPRELRFEHIGDHFDKEDRRISDYLCPQMQKRHGDLTKAEKSKARDAYARSTMI